MSKSKQPTSFGERIMRFYDSISFPKEHLLSGMEVLYPYADKKAREYARAFYDAFYADTLERTFVFGINPGRLGSGTTGVPFTDPVALEEYCGIPNTLPKRREPTSRFIYDVIESMGGAEKFYHSFSPTAVCPLGFVRNGKNFNYYDDRGFLARIKPFLVGTIRRQITCGANREYAVVLGTGNNLKGFEKMNCELGLFRNVKALPHPRYILQYQRQRLGKHIKEYQKVLGGR
jgi:hypothetical protein